MQAFDPGYSFGKQRIIVEYYYNDSLALLILLGGIIVNDTEVQNMWYYFLDLEKELADSSRYIEPEGQENVYSFEFRKIIILACKIGRAHV